MKKDNVDDNVLGGYMDQLVSGRIGSNIVPDEIRKRIEQLDLWDRQNEWRNTLRNYPYDPYNFTHRDRPSEPVMRDLDIIIEEERRRRENDRASIERDENMVLTKIREAEQALIEVSNRRRALAPRRAEERSRRGF